MCKTTYVIITGISVTAIDYAQRLVRKNTSAESIILKECDECSRKQESLKEAFDCFGMNFNLYEQNINQFIDVMKIPDTATAFICVTFLAEWFELAGEQEVSCSLLLLLLLLLPTSPRLLVNGDMFVSSNSATAAGE